MTSDRKRTSYRRFADEQTLLKIRLRDVNIISNGLAIWVTSYRFVCETDIFWNGNDENNSEMGALNVL